MIRTIIQIDEEKCTGCELCVRACHEGALGMVDGKARLLRDDYCDGMGDCLPACPAGAITFVEREAAAYDEAAVAAHMAAREAACEGTAEEGAAVTSATVHAHGGGCPGSAARAFVREDAVAAPETAHGGGCPRSAARAFVREDAAEGAGFAAALTAAAPVASQLCNWPVQIKLAPPMAPYFAGADILVAADCTAFAYGAFHQDFMRGKVTLVGCPKLDAVDYAEKLTAIFANNPIASVTVARMEVPCCGGLERAVRTALAAASEMAGREIPLRVVTISTDGRLLG